MEFKKRILKIFREELYMVIKSFQDKIQEYYQRLKKDPKDDKHFKEELKKKRKIKFKKRAISKKSFILKIKEVH